MLLTMMASKGDKSEKVRKHVVKAVGALSTLLMKEERDRPQSEEKVEGEKEGEEETEKENKENVQGEEKEAWASTVVS